MTIAPLARARTWLVAAALLACLPVEAFARTVYVTTRYAKVRDGKTATSAPVGKVDWGQALEVVREEGPFLHVRLADGKVGWIARQWTADSAPKKDGLAASLGQAARQGTGGPVTYTAGARGLSEEAKTYASTGDRSAAIAAIERLEGHKLDEAALERFQQEGQLGEFQALAWAPVACRTLVLAGRRP